ncbi:MAG: metalloregulator ArsR/SmtB family transcription factor [Planctomycetota bacterium]|nr:metalloregulator ArsR/SmtB family transcription factor [Planctomycetota bacterium]
MEINQAVRALAALAQESRLEAFRLLVRAGTDGMPAGKIAEELEVAPATLSFHLKELSNAGLVEQRREGRSIIYSLQVEAMQSLLAFLVEDCCQGQPHLCEPAFALINCCDDVPEPKKSKRS